MGLFKRRAERAAVRRASKRRKRGGRGRGPLAVQRLARNVVDGADSAQSAARSATAAVLAGDRPLWAGLVTLLALGALMLTGPFQSFLDGRERVELLERQRDALGAEIDQLERQREDLLDDTTVELRAREELGLIMPGEVPFAIVPPEVERPVIVPNRDVSEPEQPWYRSWWDTVSGWFG